MTELRTIVNIMAVVGIPSIFACVVWLAKKLIQVIKRMDILMTAVQKQMRRELTQDYHKYMDAGTIDDDDLELWVSGYNSYHDLGQNGIMDSRRDDLIDLNAHPRNKK